MATTPKSTTRTGLVYTRVRADILGGRYVPGSPLRIAPLCEEFGVSSSMIREVLIRLSEQHLVVVTPNQGFTVVAVSREDLIDLTELRIQLGSSALRKSIEFGGVEWEAQIVSAHHVLERAPMTVSHEQGTTAEWSDAHAAFHDALEAACGSPRLIGLNRTLRDSSEIYRQLSGDRYHEGARDIAHEHRELMNLAIERRADAAADAFARHLSLTTSILLAARFPIPGS